MNVPEENKENLMRAYWLGNLSVEQSEILEAQWFSNDEDAELLEASRSDLIQEYLSKNLPSMDKLNFEKNFLETNYDDVVIAKSYYDLEKKLAEDPKKVGIFEQIAEGFWNLIRVPQFAIILILLGILTPLLLFFFNSSKPAEISQANTANVVEQANANVKPVETTTSKVESNQVSNTEKVKIEANRNTQKNLQETAKNLNKALTNENKIARETKVEEETKNIPPPPTAPSPVLYLTVVRGSENTLTLSKETKNFSLKFDMPGIDKVYKSYEIRIYDANNNVVLQHPVKENLTLKKSGEKVNVHNITTSRLKKNNSYKVSLVGVDEKKQATELNSYEGFKVNK